MELDLFLDKLAQSPSLIQFEETMAAIDACYTFTPTAFTNGDVRNEANQNNGSCKIFAFAKLNELPPELTLACFGQYYRHDVLENPQGCDHANIRNFMQYGWQGIEFDGPALVAKA